MSDSQPPGVGPALSAQPLDLEPIKAHLPPPGFWSTAGEKVVWQLIAEIERLRGSVGGLNAAPPWQPIETAPKDGSDVLLYAAYYGQPIVVGTFIAYRATGKGEVRGWCNAWDGDLIDAPPTHWMPLPASPVCAAEKKS